MFNPIKTRRIKKWGIKQSTLNNLKNNFYIGIARGVGSAIGFTILGAVVLFVMQIIPMDKIPFVGKLLAEMGTLTKK